MEHWYVYYKLPEAEVGAAVARVRPMLAELSATGARCRLLRRADAPDGIATLMEVYEDIADAAAFGDRMQQALVRHGLHGATRRVERFSDL
jgi:citrate lyase beta subunit